MEELENYEPIQRQEFENNGKKYIYDFDLLVAEQGEPVIELGKFRSHQDKRVPESFDEIIRSRGAEWAFIALSYLLLEVKNDIIIPFDEQKRKQETLQFARQIPMTERSKYMMCIKDFFINTGEQSMLSITTTEFVEPKGMQILTQLIQAFSPK